MELFSIIYDFFYQLFNKIGNGDYAITIYNSTTEQSSSESINEIAIKTNGYEAANLIEFNYMDLTSWLSLVSTLIIAALLIFVAIKFIIWCFRIVGSLVALRGN